jgi:hypothetical protein
MSRASMEAYTAAAEEILAEHRSSFRRAGSWWEGLEQGVGFMARRLGADPHVAQMCMVDVFASDRHQLALRDRRRRHFVALLVDEHERRWGPATSSTRVQMEMVCGTITHRMTAVVRDGGADQLAARVGEVMADVHAVAPATWGLVAACRQGLRPLLRFLEREPEIAWQWLAVWPATDESKVNATRAHLDEALAVGLGSLHPRTVEDLWAIVHERLWRDAGARLGDIYGPLMALDALRRRGLEAGIDELRRPR